MDNLEEWEPMSQLKKLFLEKAFVRHITYFALAAISFQLSYLGATIFFPIYFFALWQLTKIKSIPNAFLTGMSLSFCLYIYHLQFFISIFNQFAYSLFCILGFWLAIFIAISCWLRKCYSEKSLVTLIPILYFSLEFIRSELYPLKFSWLIPGLAFADSSFFAALGIFGVFGISFFCFLIISSAEYLIPQKKKFWGLILLLGIICQIPSLIPIKASENVSGTRITGLQWEMGARADILASLNQAKNLYPDTELFFLNEYSFDEGIPQMFKDWCRENNTYLLAGTTETINDPSFQTSKKKSLHAKLKHKPFYNMAMVVGPTGEVVFKQAKVMPIQFFNDGVPAASQKLWESPWGNLGICICYDLSYTKITDELVRQGAQAILIPTMDVEFWGERQHKLHGRIAPTRASEYGIPIYRVCSSGISQFVNKQGLVLQEGSYPGQGDILSAQINLQNPGSRPLDRFLTYPAIFTSLIAFLYSFILFYKKKKTRKSENDLDARTAI
jgi:apolipoprotein N-acyltransferase